MKKKKIISIECKRGCGRSFSSMQRTKWEMEEDVRKKYHGICHDCLTKTEREELLNALTKQIHDLERRKDHGST